MNQNIDNLTLYAQRQSPYCRKVIVWAKTLNIYSRINVSEQNTSPTLTNSVVNALNPLGKVPIMQHGDRIVLDSVLICEYLSNLVATRQKNDDEVWHAQKYYETLGDGICDAGILIKQERERKESGNASQRFELGQKQKITRTLQRIEKDAAFFKQELHIGHIAVAVALDWLNFAMIDVNVRAYPNLLAWSNTFNARESMRDTSFYGETDDGFVLDGLIKRANEYAF